MKGRKRYWLSILAVTALYVAVTGLTIGCPFRFFLGVSCAGCGMSRSALALLQGHVREALAYHPLIFLVPVMFYSIYRCQEKNDMIGKGLLAGILFIFFLVWLIRIFLGDPIVAPDLKSGFFAEMAARFWTR